MAFSSNSSSGPSADINVTPLIDVLLVLLIIFMVIVPVAPHGLSTAVPQPPSHTTPPPESPRTVVLQVLAHPGMAAADYKLNGETVPQGGLLAMLQRIYAQRQERILFLRGDKELDFQQVAEAVGIGHQARVDTIGFVTPQMEAGR